MSTLVEAKYGAWKGGSLLGNSLSTSDIWYESRKAMLYYANAGINLDLLQSPPAISAKANADIFSSSTRKQGNSRVLGVVEIFLLISLVFIILYVTIDNQ